MPQKTNPGPLSGGHGAVTLHVDRTVDNRKALRVQAQQRLRRQHLARQVHALGARAVFELLDELDRHHGLGDDLDRRLERYAALDHDFLAALGGDRFPPLPLRLVGGAR
jgi:hypothetical protein